NPARRFYDPPQDGPEEIPSQAGGDQDQPVAVHAYRLETSWGVAAKRDQGLVPVLRCARQLLPPAAIPRRDPSDLASPAATSQPARPTLHLGKVRPNLQQMAAVAQDPAPVSQRAVCKSTSKVRAVCGSAARTDLCGGRSAMAVPTAITVSS